MEVKLRNEENRVDLRRSNLRLTFDKLRHSQTSLKYATSFFRNKLGLRLLIGMIERDDFDDVFNRFSIGELSLLTTECREILLSKDKILEQENLLSLLITLFSKSSPAKLPFIKDRFHKDLLLLIKETDSDTILISVILTVYLVSVQSS